MTPHNVHCLVGKESESLCEQLSADHHCSAEYDSSNGRDPSLLWRLSLAEYICLARCKADNQVKSLFTQFLRTLQ